MPLGPFKNLLRGGTSSGTGGAAPDGSSASRGWSLFSSRNGSDDVVSTRQSRGLEEFFNYIRDQSGLTILDLGGATQQNVSFITNLGHRLYSENFLRSLHETFGDGSEEQSNAGQIDYFLRQSLDYPEGHFDGVLLWDVLEYLSPA